MATTTAVSTQVHTQQTTGLASITDSSSKWFGRCVEALDPKHIDWDKVSNRAQLAGLALATAAIYLVTLAAAATLAFGFAMLSPFTAIATIPACALLGWTVGNYVIGPLLDQIEATYNKC